MGVCLSPDIKVIFIFYPDCLMYDLNYHSTTKEVIMSIVSWDDMEDDTPLKDAADQDIALKAAQSLKNLDLTDAHKELDEQEAAIKARQPRPIDTLDPYDPSLTNEEKKLIADKALKDPHYFLTKVTKLNGEDLEAKASRTIAEIDKYLEEGGRVQVDDKQLLNCASDLNQLVPFRYNWAWSLYLTGTENHWMPSEYPLSDDRELFDALPNYEQTNILSVLEIWKAQETVFNIGHILNAYRLITNPECRQYILRQAFEQSIVKHVKMEFEAAFPLGDYKYHKAVGFNDMIKRLHGQTKVVRQMNFSTAGIENTQKFLVDLITVYMSVLVIAPLTWYARVYEIAVANKMNMLSRTMERMIRDVQTQKNFIQMFIQTALAETDGINVSEINNQVNENCQFFMDDFSNVIGIYFRVTDSVNYKDVAYRLLQSFLTSCGLTPAPTLLKIMAQPTEAAKETLQLLERNEPKINHEAGLSGSGGSLGW